MNIRIRSFAMVAALLSGPACAGDLEPVITPGPLTAPPAFSTFPRMHYVWTGAYVGLNAGLSIGHVDWGSSLASDVPSGGGSDSSGVIGATIGYNLQVGNPWVFGAEADLQASGLKATMAVASCQPSCQVTNPWFTTARIRVGYALETILPYITVGAAFGDLLATPANPVLAGFARQYANNFGWAAGVGIEVAIWAALRAKLEYLHVDLGTISCPLNPADSVSCIGPKFNVSADLIRLGINYRIWSN